MSEVIPTVPSPAPVCTMPAAEDISEEGFGFFRGTWFIGHVPPADAEFTVSCEAEIIDWLDEVATSPVEFELLTSAIENGTTDSLPESLQTAAITEGIENYLPDSEDVVVLDSLEISVAGLTHALSAVGCLTAATCRWHAGSQSWADCPVVFFAAAAWRVEVLAELISLEGCGLDHGRGMLTVYGRSIRDTHRLAARIVLERRRFRREANSGRLRVPSGTGDPQIELLSDPQ